MKLCKTEQDVQISRMTQGELDAYEIQVRSANMVRAAESLLKLVSDIKQYLILNDFPSVNEAIAHNSNVFRSMQQESDKKLQDLRDDIISDLYELEEEYYISIHKH